MTSFLHAADLHLGAPLDALSSRVGRDKAEHLRTLASTAFERLVDVAVDQGVGAVVIAGDLYDSAEREIAAQLRLHRGLERLHDHAIPTFIVHGNHDPLQASYRPARPLPSSVTVFPPGSVTTHSVDLGSGQSISVAGISFAKAHETENLARRFADVPVAPSEPLVGVLHTNVGDVPGHGHYAPCSEQDLASTPVSYWALGHVHQRTVRALGPGRWWAYPGNLQGRSTKPTECGPKGALVVPVQQGKVGLPAFVACDGVRFERRTVSLEQAETLGDVVEVLAEAARGAHAEAGGRPILLALTVEGPTPVHGELASTRDQLVDLVREELGGTLGEGELVKVSDQTRPLVPRDQLLERGDLLATALGALDQLDPTAERLAGLARREVLGAATTDLVGQALAHAPDLPASVLAEVERLLVDRLLEAS